ncbi:MAG TPA: hypothetical protein VE974_16135 [Thermoanaerobaculia bacterium]|nr:hypothetical protein [Thermoanaerobaculia bacterium]
MIHYLTLDGRTMFSEYLEYWGRELAGSELRILRYEHLLRETRFQPGTYVFTTFDEMRGAMGSYVDALAAELRQSPHVRIFNDPRRVLRRHDLHAELARLGRNTFRSHRANGDLGAVRFPVFIRSEGAHDGALSPLLHSATAIETWIGRVLALGRPIDDLLVVEFCDTADADGSYRKYAAFNVDGRIVPRSLNYGRNWVLKFAGNDFSMAMAREELEYVRQNPHEEELREIFAIANIDYGRIDYSLLDGKVQTWEINVNPTIGRGLRPSSRTIDPELHGVREETKQVFYGRFNAAWAAVAAASPGREAAPLELRIEPLVLAAAREDRRRRWRTREAIVEAGLRLVKPLMKTPLRPLLRILYWGPQRVVRASAAPLFRALGRRARKRTSSRA